MGFFSFFPRPSSCVDVACRGEGRKCPRTHIVQHIMFFFFPLLSFSCEAGHLVLAVPGLYYFRLGGTDSLIISEGESNISLHGSGLGLETVLSQNARPSFSAVE